MGNSNTNGVARSKPDHALKAPSEEQIRLVKNAARSQANEPRQILQSAFTALSNGQFSEVVKHFADRFTFTDHALAVEFAEKTCVIQFFEKSRELVPDTVLDLISLFESGDHAIAEWKLTSAHIMSFGSIGHRTSISLRGSTVVRVENGKIARWSDYYDQCSSRRIGLASFFTDRIEY